MLYFLRRQPKLENTVAVTKFDGSHAEPIDTYLTNAVDVACTCPAYKPLCKHVKMVRDWWLMDEPDLIYDDKAHKWIPNPFTETSAIEEALDDNGG